MFRQLVATTLLAVSVVNFSPSGVLAQAKPIVAGGTGWSIGIARALAAAYMHQHPEVQITVADSVGSSGGIRALLAGEFDVGFAARPLKASEKGKGIAATVLVRTPFVIAVSNRIQGPLGLTSEAVRQVYGRQIRTWPDGTRLRLVLRTARETDNRILIEHFPGIEASLEQARTAQGAIIAYTDQEAMDLAERIPGAVVTTTLGAMLSEGRALRAIAIDGIVPSIETMTAGTYSMHITLYAVLSQASGSLSRDFLAFWSSDAGEKILRGFGCIIEHP